MSADEKSDFKSQIDETYIDMYHRKYEHFCWGTVVRVGDIVLINTIRIYASLLHPPDLTFGTERRFVSSKKIRNCVKVLS